MARIRTIKPEFFTSEDIVGLTAFARLLYVALWCEADREGRLQWKPKTFKMRYFPADDIDIEVLCEEVLDAGLVELYGDGLAFIPKFSSHQHINPRESQSALPDPKKINASARVEDASARVTNSACTVTDAQVGRERKVNTIRAVDTDTHSQLDPTFDPGFVRFWQTWPGSPRKVAKAQCAKKWRQAKYERIADQIIAHVASMKGTDQWQRGFEPAPKTYLNEQRWLDGSDPAGGSQAGMFAGCL